MLDKYKESQSVFYKYFTSALMNNKLSHAYFIETNNVSYSFNLGMDLVKFLICNGIYEESLCDSIDRGNCSDFYLIDKEDVIKKEDIVFLQKEFSFKSLNERKKIYLIKNASLLNESSANSLLKFLEEPARNIIAVLMADNVNNVKSTIISRCQVISLNNNENFNYRALFDFCFDDNKTNDENEKVINEEMQNFYKFYLNLEKESNSILKNPNIYDYALNFEQLLKFGFYLYFDLINDKLNSVVTAFLPYNEAKQQINDINNLHSLMDKIVVIEKFLNNCKFNLNNNLFFDNFIIKFGD